MKTILVRMSKALQLATRQEYERDERRLTEDAESWVEIVAPVVPRERWREVYRLAMQRHTSNFALTTAEFLAAWRSVEAAERAKANKPRCVYCEFKLKNQGISLPDCPFHGRDK